MTTVPRLQQPPKLVPGDRVAIVSPSWAGAGVFPEVHERGLDVLRREFELEPVEYPTTRRVGASAVDRARDLTAAFCDPAIKAVMAVIGGEDQITVLPHLNSESIAAHPKAYFGYSDNTNMLNFLFRLGMSSYHGGSSLVHLARPGGPHPAHLESLRRALFDTGNYEITPVESFTDLQCDWSDLRTLERELPTEPETGWEWHNADQVVEGPSWGGNLEILHWNLAANRWIQPVEEYRGCILFLETSEEMPPAVDVFRMLRNAGERGLLAQFRAIVIAKPKAWHSHAPLEVAARAAFRREQADAVLRVMETYNPSAMVLIGPDLGHTDPQYVVPYGGHWTIDGPRRRFSVTY